MEFKVVILIFCANHVYSRDNELYLDHESFGGIGVAVHPMSYLNNELHNATEDHRDKASETLNNLLTKYDNRIRPFYGRNPLSVNVSLGGVQVVEVLEGKQELATTLVLISSWIDPRLTFKEDDESINHIIITNEHMRDLWLPDTCFTNENRASVYDTGSTPNDAVILKKHGVLIRSTKLSVSSHCRFEYSGFPFDQQTCVLEIGSHAYMSLDIKYKWDQEFDMNRVLSTKNAGNFVITGVSANEHSVEGYYGPMSRVTFQITLQRAWRPFITRFYVPMITVVFVSLGSLFLSNVHLGLIVNLVNVAVLNVFVSIQSVNASTHTAYSSYFIICLVYVLTALAITVIKILTKEKTYSVQPSTSSTLNHFPESIVLTGNSRSNDIFDPMSHESHEESVPEESRRIYRSTSYPLRVPSCWRVGGRRVNKFGSWFLKHLRWILVALFLLTDYIYFKLNSVEYSTDGL